MNCQKSKNRMCVYVFIKTATFHRCILSLVYHWGHRGLDSEMYQTKVLECFSQAMSFARFGTRQPRSGGAQSSSKSFVVLKRSSLKACVLRDSPHLHK